MAAQWYFQIEGEQYGPFTKRGLKKLASRGKIDRATLVRKVGTEQWVTAGEIRGLFLPSVSEYPVEFPDRSATDDQMWIWHLRLIYFFMGMLIKGVCPWVTRERVRSLLFSPSTSKRLTNPYRSSTDDGGAKYRLIYFAFSLLLFAISLATPALYLNFSGSSFDWYTGFDCLLTGYLGIGSMQFAWFANPLLAIGWLALVDKQWRIARNYGAIAILLSWQMLAWGSLDHLGIGYYLWNLSMLVLILGAVVCGHLEVMNRR